LIFLDLRAQLVDLEKTANTREIRFLARVLRGLRHLRKRLTPEALSTFLNLAYPEDSQYRRDLLGFLAKVLQYF
jgi:hypothetical protein